MTTDRTDKRALWARRALCALVACVSIVAGTAATVAGAELVSTHHRSAAQGFAAGESDFLAGHRDAFPAACVSHATPYQAAYCDGWQSLAAGGDAR